MAGQCKQPFRMTPGLMPVVVYARTMEAAQAIYAARLNGVELDEDDVPVQSTAGVHQDSRSEHGQLFRFGGGPMPLAVQASNRAEAFAVLSERMNGRALQAIGSLRQPCFAVKSAALNNRN